MENFEELSINSPSFTEVASDFDDALQRLLRKMETSNADEGKITLEVSIVNEKVYIDADAELGDKGADEKKPMLKHKITTQIPIKSTTESKTTDTGMILVWDKDLCRYVLVYMPTQQTTMYDQPDFAGDTKTQPAKPYLTQGNVIDLAALPPATAENE